MPSSTQRCARLVAALEDLAGQEEAALRTGEFAAVASVQARTAALLDDLAAHANAADERSRERIGAVQARRARTSAWLAEEIERSRAELRQTEVSQRRVARIAPVYGGAPAKARTASQLRFVG